MSLELLAGYDNFMMLFLLSKVMANTKRRKIISGHLSQMANHILRVTWNNFYCQSRECQSPHKSLQLIHTAHLIGNEKQFDQNCLICPKNHSVTGKKKLNEVSETSAMWLECNHGVYRECINSLFRKTFRISSSWLQNTWAECTGEIQVSSMCKDHSHLKTKPPQHDKTAAQESLWTIHRIDLWTPKLNH